MKQEFYLVNKEELIQAFKEVQTKNPIESLQIEHSEKLTRQKASKFLDVSYSTMHNWTKKGMLKEHGQGRKKFYLRNELMQAMQNNS